VSLDKTEFADLFRKRQTQCETFWTNWRSEARDDYDFIAGRQISEADERKAKRQRRPLVTFNYSEKMIDAVAGAEVSNRNEVTYLPRKTESSGEADVWNAGAKWSRDECNAEDEEGDAFRDMLICGLGWTQTRVSYDDDPDGMLVVDRVDPLEMRSDPAATKAGLKDRRYQYRKWWVDKRDAELEWPNAEFTNTDAYTPPNENVVGVVTHGEGYVNDESISDLHKGQVLITCYECVEREPFYRVAVGGQVMTLTPEQYSKVSKHLEEANVKSVKQYHNVYYRGFFSGETLLEAALSPCQKGFTFQAMTGKRDRNRNTWYGLTRVMKDPQRWANKWLSQILHIINTNAKGGLMAEANAFVDLKKAQEEWGKPDSITLFKEGALANDRVREKSVVNYPAGLDKLMQFALGSLPMVTGINLEALGLANREQAGVLEQQRKQAAYGLLSPIFSSLRNYRKSQGHILLDMMNNFIADGRLIRVGGQENAQFVPLAKSEGAISYDIIVDQAPDAPDVKDKTWATLETLVPAMLKAGIPVPPDLLDYAPIPTSLATKWKQFIANNPAQNEQTKQLQEQLQQLQEENMQLKADHTAEMQKVQAQIQIMWQKLELDKAKASAEIEIKREQGQLQLQQDAAQGQMQMQHQAEEHAQAMDLQQQQVDNQHEAAMAAAKQRPAPAPRSKSKGK